MKKKQKPTIVALLRKIKKRPTSSSRLKWIVLILLILLLPLAIWSNVFSYEYYYLKCENKPIEVIGKYYRVPSDEGYGIHPGSDYSNCYSVPAGVKRDPSTKMGAVLAKQNADAAAKTKQLTDEYDIYTPVGYVTSTVGTRFYGDRAETEFTITTNANHKFYARELKKDGAFSYTGLCINPPSENWSGTIVGQDDKGRDMCKVNTSKYIKGYIVGVNIGKTAIMLSPVSTTSSLPIEQLNAEAKAIFSAMELQPR